MGEYDDDDDDADVLFFVAVDRDIGCALPTTTLFVPKGFFGAVIDMGGYEDDDDDAVFFFLTTTCFAAVAATAVPLLLLLLLLLFLLLLDGILNFVADNGVATTAAVSD